MVDKKKYGRSGCNLFILTNYSIRKVSRDKLYNIRLFKQYLKQKNFNSNYFITPIIYSFNFEDLYSFDMEYIMGKTFDEFCEEMSINKIHYFIDVVITYLKNNILNSKTTSINKSKIYDKIYQMIKTQDLSYNLFKYYDFLINNIPEKILIGPNHGDFTFSNMIFTDNFYLIDFLDNIINTSLNDLVKIKQDTEHEIFFCNLNDNHTKKSYLVAKKIDSLISKEFEFILQSSEYKWLSMFNLLRILPYLKEKKEIFNLLNIIKKNEYIIADCR